MFECPKCGGNKRTYNEMLKHIPLCDGANADMAQEAVIENFKKVETQVQAAAALSTQVNQIQYTEMLIHIMEKDSKKFYIFNSRTQHVTSHEVMC